MTSTRPPKPWTNCRTNFIFLPRVKHWRPVYVHEKWISTAKVDIHQYIGHTTQTELVKFIILAVPTKMFPYCNKIIFRVDRPFRKLMLSLKLQTGHRLTCVQQRPLVTQQRLEMPNGSPFWLLCSSRRPSFMPWRRGIASASITDDIRFESRQGISFLSL
jgi:hypothetical protein